MYRHYHSKRHEGNLLGTDEMFCHTCGCHLLINANFRSGYGWRQKKKDLFESSDTHEKLIRKYFKYRYDYKKIYLAQFVLRKVSADISDEMLCSLIEWEVKGTSSLNS